MTLELARVIAFVSLMFFIGGVIYHYLSTKKLKFPADYARPKGSWKVGVFYSFTIGMLPWKKESTRRHWIAYLRGVMFHIGIFTGLFALIVSPFFKEMNKTFLLAVALLTGLGALMGYAGIVMRLVERNLRSISTPDDYISVSFVSLFLTFLTLAILNEKFLTAMYLTSAVTLIYAPLGKIKHCIYFFFSRFFFGLHLGKRGIVHRFTEVSYGK
jgi:hypothetical protein